MSRDTLAEWQAIAEADRARAQRDREAGRLPALDSRSPTEIATFARHLRECLATDDGAPPTKRGARR